MGNSNGKPVVFTDQVNLNHFRLLRVVGKGAFGKVRIVERKDTGLTFALKYIRKDEVVRSESVRNIIRERRMLEHLNHPFICNLRYSFQDIEYMYIVVDLMNGGDLRFHISRKTFTEDAVRFWIAELGCALRYIHKQGIIHRDLKPDNVLLDSEGHVHLADFNVASDFTPGKNLTSKSGTLAYLAPEVYKGTGYSSGADWWSLGVLFYECIYNKRPFEGSTQTTLSTKIIAANPKYHVTSPPVSMPCLHAISSALEADPSKRMGSAGWQTFTDNPFFRALDFEALERKEIEPVFVPSSEKTNFDATYDLEELLLEEAPLEARARRQKPREQLKDDATDKEIREDELYKMIDNMFEPFDYTQAAYARMQNGQDPTSGPPPIVIDPTAPATPRDVPLNPKDSGRSERHRSTKSNKSTKSRNTSPPSNRHASNPPSANVSPSGSPPVQPSNLATVSTNEEKAARSRSNTTRNFSHNGHNKSSVTTPPPLSPYQRSYTSDPHGKSKAASRKESQGGGVQVVLDEQGSWTDLAKQDATLPADAKELAARGSEKPTGMLGFFNRRKGRGHSPKPQERGILGKEGARVIIN